jgi:hypothetical protein
MGDAVSSNDDPTWARLEDQIAWYDKKSGQNQRTFKQLKVLQLASAAGIPVLASTSATPWVTGILGALIVALEGIQQLNQYQQNWVTYRSTCELLRHEKYLYLANAGPYTNPEQAHALLADRIESLVSQEHAKWASATSEAVDQSKQKTG